MEIDRHTFSDEFQSLEMHIQAKFNESASTADLTDDRYNKANNTIAGC